MAGDIGRKAGKSKRAPSVSNESFTPARSRLWVTLLWVAAAAVAMILANVLGLLAFYAWHGVSHPGAPVVLQKLVTNGSAVGISTAVASPLLILFFVWAARMNGPDAAAYLALRWPGARDWGAAIAVGIAMFALEFTAERFISDPQADAFMAGTFLSARSDGTLAVLILAFVILAPASEELAFRGFFYARLEPRLGSAAAVLLTSLAWAGLHIQYGLASIAEIVVIGLMLGTLRWYSRSTLLPILIHAAWNAAGLVGIALANGH